MRTEDRSLAPDVLDFEVARRKKYRLVFHTGSFKEQVQ